MIINTIIFVFNAVFCIDSAFKAEEIAGDYAITMPQDWLNFRNTYVVIQ